MSTKLTKEFYLLYINNDPYLNKASSLNKHWEELKDYK